MNDSKFELSDRQFDAIKTEIRRLEDRVSGLMLERELSVAAADIVRMEGWRVAQDRVASISERQIQRLKTENLGEYWTGRIQGFLRAMEVMMSIRPLSPEDLARIEEEVTVSTDRIAELRNLLI